MKDLKISLNVTSLLEDKSSREILEQKISAIEKAMNIPNVTQLLQIVITSLINYTLTLNLKIVFFKENGYDINDPADYEKGSAEFLQKQEIFSKPTKEEFLKEMHTQVTLTLDASQHRLLLYIHNDTPFFALEESNLRKKMQTIMEAKTLIEFLKEFDINSDHFNLALIVQLIRKTGFDANHFRLYNEGDRSIARLEFPLSDDYVSLRNAKK